MKGNIFGYNVPSYNIIKEDEYFDKFVECQIYIVHAIFKNAINKNTTINQVHLSKLTKLSQFSESLH